MNVPTYLCTYMDPVSPLPIKMGLNYNHPKKIGVTAMLFLCNGLLFNQLELPRFYLVFTLKSAKVNNASFLFPFDFDLKGNLLSIFIGPKGTLKRGHNARKTNKLCASIFC